MAKYKEEKKLLKFLYNPWIIGIAFYLLGLLTPKTIATVKDFNFIKRETIHNINVDTMYVNSVGNNSNKFYFIFFLLILIFLIVLLVNSFDEDDSKI